MRPGGTNLCDPEDLRRGSQTPWAYDAHPRPDFAYRSRPTACRVCFGVLEVQSPSNAAGHPAKGYLPEILLAVQQEGVSHEK